MLALFLSWPFLLSLKDGDSNNRLEPFCTPQAYATLIRAGLAFCKIKQIVVAPLLLDKGNKSNGKTFPKGVFLGAEAFLPNSALEMLARAFAKGAKPSPSSWNMPFDSLL